MSEKLMRIIDLINRTGDRLIVYDPNEVIEPYVVLRLEDYEKLLGETPKTLTDCDLSDKINRDIEDWQKNQNLRQTKSDLLEQVLMPTSSVEPKVSQEIEENLTNLALTEDDESVDEEIVWQADNSKPNNLSQSTRLTQSVDGTNPYHRKDDFLAISSILEDRQQQFDRIRRKLKS